MARQKRGDATQLLLFDDPIFWWPGVPPRPREEIPNRRPRPPEVVPPAIPQLKLFDLPDLPAPGRRRSKRLRTFAQPTTYLDLACLIGLPRLVGLLNLPATYYLMDASPLRLGLGADTLLDARYRIQSNLLEAFEDLANLGGQEIHSAPLSLWAGRKMGVASASSPRGEVLSLAIASADPQVMNPFLMRLRGLPGYLFHEDGPPPLEEGEELLSLYDHETLYELLPEEAQPMSLLTLLAG